MFYRLKFDSHLSEIFKHARLYDSIFEIWPAGQTPIAVREGKARGWGPAEAAAGVLAEFVAAGFEHGRLDHRTAYDLIHSCYCVAMGPRTSKPIRFGVDNVLESIEGATDVTP
jgi:hypothetical protein